MQELFVIMFKDTPGVSVQDSLRIVTQATCNFLSMMNNEEILNNRFYSELIENTESRDFIFFQKELSAWRGPGKRQFGKVSVRQADCNQVEVIQRAAQKMSIVFDIFEDWDAKVTNHYNFESHMISEACMLTFLDSQIHSEFKTIIDKNSEPHY